MGSYCEVSSCEIVIVSQFVQIFTMRLVNPSVLRMAKTLLSFGHSECSRVKRKHFCVRSVKKKETQFDTEYTETYSQVVEMKLSLPDRIWWNSL